MRAERGGRGGHGAVTGSWAQTSAPQHRQPGSIQQASQPGSLTVASLAGWVSLADSVQPGAHLLLRAAPRLMPLLDLQLLHV